MTGGKSRTRVHYAQRCRIGDVIPVVERGLGHRFPVVLRLAGQQSQRGLDIDVFTSRAVDRGGDSYGHGFGEDNLLWLKRNHRTHSHPFLEVIEGFIRRLNL